MERKTFDPKNIVIKFCGHEIKNYGSPIYHIKKRFTSFLMLFYKKQ